MRIKMKTAAAGPTFTAHAGAEIELPDAQAMAMIKAGHAEVVKAKSKPPAKAADPEASGEADEKKPSKEKRA